MTTKNRTSPADLIEDIVQAQLAAHQSMAWVEFEAHKAEGRRLYHITSKDRRSVDGAIETRRRTYPGHVFTVIGPQQLQDGSFVAMVEIAEPAPAESPTRENALDQLGDIRATLERMQGGES